MTKAVVRILNSAFIVSPSREMHSTFMNYIKRMYRYEFKKQGRKVDKSFVYENVRELKEKWLIEAEQMNEYRIHISYLKEFRYYFKHIDIEYIIEEPCQGDEVTIEMQDWFSPRGEQGDWINFLTGEGVHMSLPATMGAGKTVTFLACASEYGRRTAAILPPFLSDRWMLEIAKFTKLERRDYVYITGMSLLKSYMTTLEEGRNPFKIVLFSINTLRNYIRDYYENPTEFIYSPEELFRKAGFGLKGVDEAHKELHFHFLSTMFFNTSKYINLSGTLGKENEFLNEMAERLYPMKGRCPVEEAEANTNASIYKLYFSGWIPHHKSPMGYSQIIMENNIRYHPSVCKAYFSYLAKILYAEYAAIRIKEGDKALVFLATTKLADMFVEYLETESGVADAYAPFRIGRLRAGEADEKCQDLDIVVTTVGRAGTGFDLPGVLTVFNTISISDGPLQRQVLGRGRKRDDVDCRYVRLYSPHIKKHVDYHLKSLKTLGDLCTKITTHELPGAIPFPTGYDFDNAKRVQAEERAAKKAKKSKKKKKAKK